MTRRRRWRVREGPNGSGSLLLHGDGRLEFPALDDAADEWDGLAWLSLEANAFSQRETRAA